jgi:multimeric flavodoxin WrbA
MRKQDKKIAVIFQGSPRKRGNTVLATGCLASALKKRGWLVKTYYLYSMQFRGCAHCDACKKISDKPGCVLKDDLQSVLDIIPQAQALIIASPVYCWSVSGCTSALLDRFYSLIKAGKHLVEGKNMIGVFTAAGDAFDGMDLCVEMLKRYCEYTKVNYVGTLAVPDCTTPQALSKNNWLKQSVNQLADQM